MSGSKGQEIVYTWARLNTPTHKELSDTIDAALRRAKAEGIREARARIEHAFEHGDIVQDVLDDLDARAAQIEEGEHDDSHTSND